MNLELKAVVDGFIGGLQFTGILALYGVLLGIPIGIAAVIAYGIFKVMT